MVLCLLLVGCSGSSGPAWTVTPEIKGSRIQLSPDGSLLAVASVDGKVLLIKAADGSPKATLAGGPKKPTHLVFSPDSKQLASASSSKRKVGWWATSDGRSVASVAVGEAAVKARVVRHNNIRWINLRTGKTYGSKSHVGGKSASDVSGLSFLADGTLVTVDDRGAVQFWNTDGEITDEIGFEGRVSTATLSPTGQYLALSGNNRLNVLALPEGKRQFQMSANGPFQKLTYSPDGAYLATSAFGEVKILSLKTKTKLGKMKGEAFRLAFSTSGRHLIAAKNKTVEVWDIYKKSSVGTIKRREVKGVALLDDDGRRVLLRKNKVTLWDTAEPKKPLWSLEKKSKGWAVAPDGKSVTLLLEDGRLEHWELPE